MSEVFTMHPTVQMRNTWTVDDLATLEVQDWWRYEILDGSLVVSPSATTRHEIASAELRALFRAAGQLAIGPIGVKVGKGSYFIPDVVIVDDDIERDIDKLTPEQARLVIEIESPGSVSMDRIVKPAKYAAAGVRHYWRLETKPLRLSAYRLDGEVYAEVGVWNAGETAHLTEPFDISVEVGTLLRG